MLRPWRWFGSRPLTQPRIWFAFTVAVFTDGLQILFGPLGWAFVDEGLDVLAMVLISATLGFHILLLPTFALELLPVTDMLPTWTGCTAAVVMLRRREFAKTDGLPPKQINSQPESAQRLLPQ